MARRSLRRHASVTLGALLLAAAGVWLRPVAHASREPTMRARAPEPRAPKRPDGARGALEVLGRLLPGGLPRAHRARTRAVADRVVVVSLDGLRRDAVGEATPTLMRLAREGAVPAEAWTIAKSVTLPSHASMLTGVEMARHGLRFNHWNAERRRVQFPTVFHVAHRAGLETSMFIGKPKLQLLSTGDEVGTLRLTGSACTRVNEAALPHLARVRTGVHFVHYADPDAAGHREGWMGELYRRNVARADRCLAELVATLERRGDLAGTLLLVTADHGGHGRLHGTTLPEDRAVPWIAWGGPAAVGELPGAVHTIDTAATVLAALGLEPAAGTQGSPVTAALRGPSR